MKNDFLLRVISEGSVDTKKYRYLYRQKADHVEIVRLPLWMLDTVLALSAWELVYTIR